MHLLALLGTRYARLLMRTATSTEVGVDAEEHAGEEAIVPGSPAPARELATNEDGGRAPQLATVGERVEPSGEKSSELGEARTRALIQQPPTDAITTDEDSDDSPVSYGVGDLTTSLRSIAGDRFLAQLEQLRGMFPSASPRVLLAAVKQIRALAVARQAAMSRPRGVSPITFKL